MLFLLGLLAILLFIWYVCNSFIYSERRLSRTSRIKDRGHRATENLWTLLLSMKKIQNSNNQLRKYMAYQCIPLTTKEYKETLANLMETPTKAKKFNAFSEKYKSITKAIKTLETLESDKHLSSIISDLKQQQTLCQEGMAKMLDTVYRAMQREQKKSQSPQLKIGFNISR